MLCCMDMRREDMTMFSLRHCMTTYDMLEHYVFLFCDTCMRAMREV